MNKQLEFDFEDKKETFLNSFNGCYESDLPEISAFGFSDYDNIIEQIAKEVSRELNFDFERFS